MSASPVSGCSIVTWRVYEREPGAPASWRPGSSSGRGLRPTHPDGDLDLVPDFHVAMQDPAVGRRHLLGRIPATDRTGQRRGVGRGSGSGAIDDQATQRCDQHGGSGAHHHEEGDEGQGLPAVTGPLGHSMCAAHQGHLPNSVIRGGRAS
jgi:hypothetical protein